MYEVIKNKKEIVENMIVEYITNSAQKVINLKSEFKLSLPGGKSPSGIYKKLSSDYPYWNFTKIYLTDERFVPSDNEKSNLKFLKETLGDDKRIFSPSYSNDIVISCLEYNEQLEEADKLDFILLSLGADGHFASIFPGSECINYGRFACITEGPDGLKRISMNLNFIKKSDDIIFIILGKAKEEIFRKLQSESFSPLLKVLDRENIKVYTDCEY